jgi:hypothetical protein
MDFLGWWGFIYSANAMLLTHVNGIQFLLYFAESLTRLDARDATF